MMEQLFYLFALLFSIAGMVIIDWRWKLAFWYDARRTGIVIGLGILIFVLWDFFGISTGVFFHGDSAYMLPFTIFPEFPIEELFFLFLLCYTTLIIYRGLGRWRRIS